MSAIYRIVSPRRLTAPALVARTLEARVVYHHLLCGEVACQVPGLVRVGVLGLAEETNLDPSVVRRALQELVLHQLLEVDEAARLIRLPGVPGDHARAFAGANNVKGCVEALRTFPESPIRERHAAEIQAVCPEELRPLWTGLVPRSKPAAARPAPPPPAPSEPPPDPLVDPVPNPIRTKEKEQEQEKEVPDDDAGASGRLGHRIGMTRISMGFGIALVATRTGIPAATLRAIESGEAEPTRDELALLAKALGDPSLASAPGLDAPELSVTAIAVDALHEARRELGADEPRPQVCGDLVRAACAPRPLVPEGMTLAACWPLVIRRATEEARRNAEDGRGRRDLEFLTLRHLAEPGRWRRYLGNSDLDVRRPPTAERTQKPKRGLKGPPPPENGDDVNADFERM